MCSERLKWFLTLFYSAAWWELGNNTDDDVVKNININKSDNNNNNNPNDDDKSLQNMTQ